MAEKRVRNKSTGRNYKKEYETYGSKPEHKKERAKRNAARRKMEKEGKVHKGDGKDVDHKRSVSGGNGDSNLRVQPKSKNRSYSRNSDGSVRKKSK